MKWNKIIAVLTSVLLMFCMTACGSSTNGNNGKGKSNKGTNASNLDWSAGADASGGKVTIKVASWRHNDREYYEEIVRRFEEKYNWIEVDLSLTADSSSYYTNLQADLAFGEGVDVFDCHPGRLSSFASDGIAAPQTDFDYIENLTDAAKQIAFIDGDCYGYPNAYNYLGFMYNVDVFKQYGLEPPQTPEELVNVVNKLKAAGYGGISYAGGHKGDSLAKNVLYNTMGLDGYEALAEKIDDGSLLDISTNEEVKSTLDTLTYYADKDIYYNAYEAISFDAGMSLFAQKKTAIIYEGSWAIGEKDHYFPGINVAFFPVPTFANTGRSFCDSAQISIINSNSKALGAAKLWVEFLATPEISEYYCNNANMNSNIKGVKITHDWEPSFFNGDYVLESNHATLKYYDYWSNSFSKVFEKALFGGGDWKPYVSSFEDELNTLNLKGKQ